MAKYKPKVVNTEIYKQGVKGMKTGNISRLRTISEQELIHMSKEDMAHLIASTSKQVVQSIRNVKKKYGDLSAFIRKRQQNNYAMPKETKFKTAMRKDEKTLQQEIRDLAYIARLKTTSLSSMKTTIKAFKQETGKDLIDLTSTDREKERLINQLIKEDLEQGIETTREQIIEQYGDEALTESATATVSERWEKIRKAIEEGYDSTSVIKAYDVESNVIKNLDQIEKSQQKAKQKASQDISSADMFSVLGGNMNGTL